MNYDFKIVKSDNREDFEKMIINFLRDGYELHGNLLIEPPVNGKPYDAYMYVQAVMKAMPKSGYKTS